MQDSSFKIPTWWSRGKYKLSAKTIDTLDLYCYIKPKGQEQAYQLWEWLKSEKPFWKDLGVPFSEDHDFRTMCDLSAKIIEISGCEVKKKGCFFHVNFNYQAAK